MAESIIIDSFDIPPKGASIERFLRLRKKAENRYTPREKQHSEESDDWRGVQETAGDEVDLFDIPPKGASKEKLRRWRKKAANRYALWEKQSDLDSFYWRRKKLPRAVRRRTMRPATADESETASTDESEIQVETVPPDFFKWIDDTDAAADKVDIHSEDAAWKQQSIYQVIISAENHKPINAFAPQMISFGPFHHGAEHLKDNEEHKRRALAHFLHRAQMQSQPFVSKLGGILKQLQDSYQGLDEKWKKNPYEFLKMMLLDGCFMIEVLRTNERSYAPNDPVFSSQMRPLCKPYIKRDMLLLENQFPLLVLKALLKVERLGPTDDKYINNLVLSYCSDNLKANFPRLASPPLELYHMSSLGEDTIVQLEMPTINMTKPIENAIKLKENGIRFKNSQSKSLRDINFNAKTGLLELPEFPIDDGTEHLLLNMIAYEKFTVGVGFEIMSYIKFLYELIDTEDDVKLLEDNGIISNSLGSKAITDLFNNSLAKVVVVVPSNDSHPSILRSMLSEYYHSKKEKDNLFLRHPWKVLSVVTVSLVLTFVQTICSLVQIFQK